MSSGSPSFLAELFALVAASALIAYLCHRLRILPIVGFLLAGVAIGPHALGLVRDEAVIESLADIGVILLLFTLGIEFSLDRLARIKRAIVLGGGLQMGLTIAATMAAMIPFGIGWRTALFTGSLVALSSTVIVLKVLGEENEITSAKGQLALGILIFQDLAVIALVLLVPILGGTGGSTVLMIRNTAIGIVLVALILVVARRVMPPILERVARTCSQEIFLLTIIALCLGTAWLTSLAGVSVSLGAFLAGLVMSESRYSHHAFAEILPLQILFSAVFFVSVGLLLDLAFVVEHPVLIVGVVAGIAVLKIVTTGASALLLRYPVGTAAATAFLIAQIGEFSFVLERAGHAAGLYPAGAADVGGQTFIAAAVLLMVATPLLGFAGRAIESRSARPQMPAEEMPAAGPVNLENHVIVAGYGSTARYLTRVLRDSRIPFQIATLSPTGATEAERDGLPVMLGDYSRQAILERVAIERAKMLVIADDAPDMSRRVTAIARGLNPTLRIVVRTRANQDVESHLAAGADDVLVDELEIGIQLSTRVLADYHVSRDEIDDHVATVRAGGYAALRGGISDVPLVQCEDLTQDCFDTRTFTVRAGTPATQMTVGEFTKATGVAIVSIERSGEPITPLEPDLALAAGDRITARGSTAAFLAAAELLRGTTSARAESAVRVIALSEEQRHTAGCEHVASVEPEIASGAIGCEDCLRIGDTWVHLRICMTCGAVRCCDSSKNRHATKHYQSVHHPIIKSYQPDESWAWCYPDELVF